MSFFNCRWGWIRYHYLPQLFEVIKYSQEYTEIKMHIALTYYKRKGLRTKTQIHYTFTCWWIQGISSQSLPAHYMCVLWKKAHTQPWLCNKLTQTIFFQPAQLRGLGSIHGLEQEGCWFLKCSLGHQLLYRIADSTLNTIIKVTIIIK